MKASFESPHRAQVQRQKVEKQRPVGLRSQRDHLALLGLPGMVVNILQVGGLSAQTWTVIHQLAIDFARRKINEWHFLVDQPRPEIYSIRRELTPLSRRPSLPVRYRFFPYRF